MSIFIKIDIYTLIDMKIAAKNAKDREEKKEKNLGALAPRLLGNPGQADCAHEGVIDK